MYEVKDGTRTLQFSGQKLAYSTSRHRDSSRWIEFTLYKTDGGSYVLSRVGVSLTFHAVTCELVSKYGLHEADVTDLSKDAVPCLECRPSYDEPFVYPEEYRYWKLVSDDAQTVLDALYKYDQNGTRYLTKVAQRLVEDASRQDPELDAVYRIEVIP